MGVRDSSVRGREEESGNIAEIFPPPPSRVGRETNLGLTLRPSFLRSTPPFPNHSPTKETYVYIQLEKRSDRVNGGVRAGAGVHVLNLTDKAFAGCPNRLPLSLTIFFPPFPLARISLQTPLPSVSHSTMDHATHSRSFSLSLSFSLTLVAGGQVHATYSPLF